MTEQEKLHQEISEMRKATEQNMQKLGEDVEVKMQDLGNSLDQTIKNIQEIQDAVKEQKDAPTLDEEKVERLLKANLDKVEEKIAELKKSSPPQRKGELVGINGFQAEHMGVIQKGPMAGQKVATAIFAYNFLKQAQILKEARNIKSLEIAPPSKYLEGIINAYTEGGAGTGDELVPTEMAATLWQDFFTESRVLAQLDAFDMPSNPFQSPLDFAEATFTGGTENTAPSDDDAATRNVTYTAKELVNVKTWSYSLDEASIVAMLPSLMRNVGRGARRYMDRFIINADATDAATGNINLDDADPDSDEYFLSTGQDGVRHLWLVDNTSQEVNAGGNALQMDHITDLFKNLDEYGVDVENLRIFSGIRTYLKGMLGLPEIQTIDKFGPMATIQTGEAAKVLGAPIIPTEAQALTEADGKVSTTAANNTLGQISAIHKDMWSVGFFRRLLMEVDVDIKKRQFFLVTSFRIALAAFGTRASANHTAGIRNIGL